MKRRKSEQTKHTSLRITPEAREALDRLPSYIMDVRFLQHYDLLDPHLGNVHLHVTDRLQPHHSVHLRSILIINLVNAFMDMEATLTELKIAAL